MKVYINHLKDLHFIGSARDHLDIDIDEPSSFHGTNKGASPVEYLLLSIGSCLGSTFVYCLKRAKIRFKDLNIIVDGTLKHKGFKGSLRIISIKVDISIEMIEGNKQDFKKCEKNFQKYCIISNVIDKNIKLDINIKNYET
ncbi:MAG: OsmC family protein [Candidatus Lokiarchaeota archaeon]